MTMFPMNMPELPMEFVTPIMNDPGSFADVITGGMDAFATAMEGGGDLGACFTAFADAAGPMCADMGISPEVFDHVGDMFGGVCGTAMTLAPADAGPADVGAIMVDAASMMMPEGMDVPAEIGSAMADMGATMCDAGPCHEIAGEMMPPPGDPESFLPEDVVPGEPTSVPDEFVQPPPMDGACNDCGPHMMPPEGGYDHVAMGPDMEVPMGPEGFQLGEHPDHQGPQDGPPPFGTSEGEVAGGPLAPDQETGMAPPDPTGALSGAENIAPPPVDDVAPPADMAALGDALGGNPADEPAPAEPADVADAAIGAAMDAATDQGGAPGADAGANADAGHDDHDHEPEEDTDSVDPSAGMG